MFLPYYGQLHNTYDACHIIYPTVEECGSINPDDIYINQDQAIAGHTINYLTIVSYCNYNTDDLYLSYPIRFGTIQYKLTLANKLYIRVRWAKEKSWSSWKQLI